MTGVIPREKCIGKHLRIILEHACGTSEGLILFLVELSGDTNDNVLLLDTEFTLYLRCILLMIVVVIHHRFRDGNFYQILHGEREPDLLTFVEIVQHEVLAVVVEGMTVCSEQIPYKFYLGGLQDDLWLFCLLGVCITQDV